MASVDMVPVRMAEPASTSRTGSLANVALVTLDSIARRELTNVQPIRAMDLEQLTASTWTMVTSATVTPVTLETIVRLKLTNVPLTHVSMAQLVPIKSTVTSVNVHQDGLGHGANRTLDFVTLPWCPFLTMVTLD